jgi:hypothetical protein
VNNVTITNIDHLVPVLTTVQLNLPTFFFRLCIFLLFPFHRLSLSPFLEINFKLFCVKFLRIPSFNEIIMPDPAFDHMFLYDILAPSLK